MLVTFGSCLVTCGCVTVVRVLVCYFAFVVCLLLFGGCRFLDLTLLLMWLLFSLWVIYGCFSVVLVLGLAEGWGVVLVLLVGRVWLYLLWVFVSLV